LLMPLAALANGNYTNVYILCFLYGCQLHFIY
jgi:hypothetical protein